MTSHQMHVVSENSPPPPYSCSLDLSPSAGSRVNHASQKSSSQFLAFHQLILTQETELDRVRCLLVNAPSPLSSALRQRQTDLVSELLSLRLRRKQLAFSLLHKDSLLSLPNRQRKLQSDVDNLSSLLQNPACDVETARVLACQLQWKRLKLQAVNQRLVRTEWRLYPWKLLQVFLQRPQTVALTIFACVIMGKLGLGLLRRLCVGMGNMVWFVGRQLVGVARPKLFVNLCVLMLLSRWLGKRALLLVFLLLAFKFR